MTRYEQGFLTKCAEHGVDAGTAMGLMKRAQVSISHGKDTNLANAKANALFGLPAGVLLSLLSERLLSDRGRRDYGKAALRGAALGPAVSAAMGAVTGKNYPDMLSGLVSSIRGRAGSRVSGLGRDIAG